MNLSKSIEFFNPTKVKERVHIIGCGASGSTVAELLARAGLEKITLYDFDKVESHNIANQMFKDSDIGRNKAEAVKDMMLSINPDANGIEVVQEGYTNQRLSGYVFLWWTTLISAEKFAKKMLETRISKLCLIPDFG